MSSIRFYILGSLAQHGEMHGHQLRLLAEEEHVHLWTDISVGSLYGAIKRLAVEGLIEVVRVEREGNFPERQVYAISDAGREALAGIRQHQLTDLTFRPDPFDLALTRLDGDGLDEVPAIIQSRVSALETLLAETEAANARALPYLTLSETHAMKHREHRIRAELDWHRQLGEAVPDIVQDERLRNAGGRAPLPTGQHSAPTVHSSPPPPLPPDVGGSTYSSETGPRKASTHV